MSASYGGVPIFGQSVSVEAEKEESEFQFSAFFGVGGKFSLWGGARGRRFMVKGVLVDADRPSIDAQIINIESSYDDGVGRTLTDTGTRSWDQVVFIKIDAKGPFYHKAGGGCAVAHTCYFVGLLP